MHILRKAWSEKHSVSNDTISIIRNGSPFVHEKCGPAFRKRRYVVPEKNMFWSKCRLFSASIETAIKTFVRCTRCNQHSCSRMGFCQKRIHRSRTIIEKNNFSGRRRSFQALLTYCLVAINSLHNSRKSTILRYFWRGMISVWYDTICFQKIRALLSWWKLKALYYKYNCCHMTLENRYLFWVQGMQ